MSIIGILFWLVFSVAMFCELFGLGPDGFRWVAVFIELFLLGIGTFNGTLFARKA